jgi:hypothetical protein
MSIGQRVHHSLLLDIFPKDLFSLVNKYSTGKEFYYNKYTQLYHLRFCKNNLIYVAITKLYGKIKIVKNDYENIWCICLGFIGEDTRATFVREIYSVEYVTIVTEENNIIIDLKCWKYMKAFDEENNEYFWDYGIIYQRYLTGRFNLCCCI